MLKNCLFGTYRAAATKIPFLSRTPPTLQPSEFGLSAPPPDGGHNVHPEMGVSRERVSSTATALEQLRSRRARRSGSSSTLISTILLLLTAQPRTQTSC